jgi:uncharacterized membrane protein YhaH (DUF805 family)
MNSLPYLGVLLLIPAFALLTWLGLLARRTRARAMLGWSTLALSVATIACVIGEAQPGRGGHVLWPQVAAATGAFVGFVCVWALGLWVTRVRVAR